MLRTTLFLASVVASAATTEQQPYYGVDCSFPIHHQGAWTCPDGISPRQEFYENFMQGCRDYYGPHKGYLCDSTETTRLEMSLRQPQSMVNFTSTGFKKIKAPKQVMDLLRSHWEANKHLKEKEVWPTGYTYVNYWSSPTYMVSVENRRLRGGGSDLKDQIWNAAKTTIEEWTGMEQRPSSLYGIRIYTQGAVLVPHVDRIPLISSCIINVAQDVDEPWPLEVIDRYGNAVNVTMEPGEMVLYESGSLIHARPFPLKGRYFANIFIHFEPTGRPLGDTSSSGDDYLEELDDFYPPYLQPNSPWAEDWANENPSGWRRGRPSPAGPKQHSGSHGAHVAAALGDLDTLKKLAETNKSHLFHQRDANGWEGLHEAVRAGHTEAAHFLISHGADKNSRTGRRRDGASPLHLALQFHHHHDDDKKKAAPIVEYLQSIGAKNIAPGQQDEL